MPSSKRKMSRKSRSRRAKKKSRRNDGTLDEYNKLIEKFKIKDKDNRTVLMKLVHRNNIDYAKKYMKEQIDNKLTPPEQIEYVNKKDDIGFTALTLASINGNLNLIQYLLLEKKALRDPKYLIYVINANKLKVVEEIINDESTSDQYSLILALFYSVRNKLDNEIIECLLDNIVSKKKFIDYIEKLISLELERKDLRMKDKINLYTEVILTVKKYLEKYS
jgi:ankyrin repeat protein